MAGATPRARPIRPSGISTCLLALAVALGLTFETCAVEVNPRRYLPRAQHGAQQRPLGSPDVGPRRHPQRYYEATMRLRGGSSLEESSKAEEEPEWIEEEGMYKLGDFLFHTPVEARRLTDEHFFAKEPGSMLWPLNWPKQFKTLLAGHPQRTTYMQRINRDDSDNGPLVMIDGADDLASALQGSGLPQRLQFALQAFVLYPLVLPVVELGFKGAEGDRQECQEAADEARDTVDGIKRRIGEELSVPMSDCLSITPDEASSLLMTSDGRRLMLSALRAKEPVKPPPPPPPATEVANATASAPRLSMWRQHSEDESFIRDTKSLVRLIGEGGQRGKPGIEASVRLLSSLEEVVSEAWEPRVRAVVTSPCAMIGTAGMWWAMLGHELAALCNFIGGSNAAKIAKAATSVSEIGLPVAQLSMALYGMSVCVNGLFEAHHFARLQHLLKTSRVLGTCKQPRASLSKQVRALARSNVLAQIIAGPVLAVGQICMALGGPAVLSSLPCLLVGGALTGISIASKAFFDILENKRFGFDENALPVRSELLKDVPSSGVAAEGAERKAVEMLQARRRMQLHQLSWIKLLKLCKLQDEQERRRRGYCFGWLGKTSGHSEEGALDKLMSSLRGCYKRGYQSELRRVLMCILDSNEALSAVKQCIARAGDTTFMSYIALSTVRLIESQTWHSVVHTLDCTEHSPTHGDGPCSTNERNAELAGMMKQAIAEWDGMSRKGQVEAVLDLLHKDNLSQFMQQSVLNQMITEGPWSMQPLAKHAPFLEVVNFCEARSLGVPFLTLGTYNHKKKAYRFCQDAFLKALDAKDRTLQSQTGLIARSDSTAGDPQSAATYPAEIEGMVAQGAWLAVKVHRKHRARSELGCLNDALIAMVRQRALKKELGVSLPLDV